MNVAELLKKEMQERLVELKLVEAELAIKDSTRDKLRQRVSDLKDLVKGMNNTLRCLKSVDGDNPFLADVEAGPEIPF